MTLPLTGRDLDRFWTFVDKRGTSGCWQWTGYTASTGYGKLWLHGSTPRAHRLSYCLHKGPIPDGHMVRHTCDNKSCVNPDHLLTGTVRDNAQDALDRDRYRRGVDNYRARLTEDEVHAIRSAAAVGETQVALASRYGVSRSAIQWILKGKTWAHLMEAS